MRKRSFFFLVLGVLIMLFFSYSCTVRGPLIPPSAHTIDYKEASLQELINMINQRSEMIASLTASLEIDFRPVVEKNYRSCKGRLLLEKPDMIRLTGYRSLLPTFFLLVSNGSDYWLSIPSKKRVYLGKVEEVVISEDFHQEEMYLTPSHIIDSLFLEKIKLNDYRKAFLDILPDMYIISIIEFNSNGVIVSKKRIWIERKNLTIFTHEFFDPEGRVLSVVNFRNYKDFDGVELPSLVHIHRPWERIYLRLVFDKINLNSPIEKGAFEFVPPEDQQIIDLSDKKVAHRKLVQN